jgi:hypothetical protein
LASPDASIALQARGCVGSNRTAPSNRRAAAGPNARRQCFVVGIGRLEPCSHAGGGFRSSGERGLRRSAHPTVHRLAQEGVSAKSAAHLDIRRTFGWRSPFFAGCTPRKGDSDSKRSFHVRPRGFRALAWRTKGTREIRSRAEHRRTNSLQHGCFYSGLNSAPNSCRIPPRQALAAPRVRISLAPPWSPSLFAIQRQTIEIRAIAGDFAELVAAENAPNRGFRRFAARLICRNRIRGHDEMRPTTRRR